MGSKDFASIKAFYRYPFKHHEHAFIISFFYSSEVKFFLKRFDIECNTFNMFDRMVLAKPQEKEKDEIHSTRLHIDTTSYSVNLVDTILKTIYF